jgi:acyl-CoA thioesterase I
MRTQYGRMAILSRRSLLGQAAGLYMGGAVAAFNAAAAAVAPVKIVAFGDSLTAGFQLPPSDAFPAQLARVLEARGHRIEMINAGVSGDTTAAGRDRLAWAVPADTDAVILEFGANDALRGLSPAAARANLEAMIAALKGQGAEILLAGMLAPRSMGEPYVRDFDAIFPELAAKHGLLLYPFFLEATALKPELSLPDGLHPNAKGVAAMVASILPQAEALIARVEARRKTKG